MSAVPGDHGLGDWRSEKTGNGERYIYIKNQQFTLSIMIGRRKLWKNHEAAADQTLMIWDLQSAGVLFFDSVPDRAQVVLKHLTSLSWRLDPFSFPRRIGDVD